VAADFFTPQSVYAWPGGSPLFGGPFPVSSPVTFSEVGWNDDGDELDAVGLGTAMAGFTAVPTVGQAAIVVGNSGRTIANGWLFDELNGANGVNLVANEISYVLSGAIPEPATLSLLALGGLALVRRRRRR
jgi:hypothetical protein